MTHFINSGGLGGSSSWDKPTTQGGGQPSNHAEHQRLAAAAVVYRREERQRQVAHAMNVMRTLMAALAPLGQLCGHSDCREAMLFSPAAGAVCIDRLDWTAETTTVTGGT